MLQNITLNADKQLIKKARAKAQKNNTSLNKAFREWLTRYSSESSSEKINKIFKKLAYAKVDKKFTRDQMNER